jgi:prepilin-type processing-associated H-X9-DG protein
MKRPCFTLIELLVVIAIIILFIAISLPSLQNSKRQAELVLCSSNIRQLALGLTTYEADNSTFPQGFDNTNTLLKPPPGGFPGSFQYDRMGWWWFNYIIDYSKSDFNNKSIIWCPSRKIQVPDLKYNALCANYGINQFICKSSSGKRSQVESGLVGKPLSSSDIPYPSRTLLIVDSGYSLINWWHVTDTPPVPLGSTIEDSAYVPGLDINKDKTLWPGLERDAIYGRHPNKTVNLGFVDGHIEGMNANDLFVEKTADDYKNKTPLWSPRQTQSD